MKGVDIKYALAEESVCEETSEVCCHKESVIEQKIHCQSIVKCKFTSNVKAAISSKWANIYWTNDLRGKNDCRQTKGNQDSKCTTSLFEI